MEVLLIVFKQRLRYHISSIKDHPSNTNCPLFRNCTHHILLLIVTAPHLPKWSPNAIIKCVRLYTFNYKHLGFVYTETLQETKCRLFLRFHSRFRGVYTISSTFQKVPLWRAFSKWKRFRAHLHRFHINKIRICKERFESLVENISV